VLTALGAHAAGFAAARRCLRFLVLCCRRRAHDWFWCRATDWHHHCQYCIQESETTTSKRSRWVAEGKETHGRWDLFPYFYVV